MLEIRSDQQWKREIKQRDGDACRACGETIPLHAHHIKPRSKYPELALELDNGITLCGNCHARLTGREESTNLRAIIPDTQTADQLTRLHGIFCDSLYPQLISDDTRNDAVFQLFSHLQIYPDSLNQFLPIIRCFLNRENRTDTGVAEQMVVEFLKHSSSEAASQVVIEYERRITTERHNRHAESDEITELRRRAESGDTAAECYICGWCYANGRGVIQNDEKAIEWYQKAAEQGHAIAQYDLSWMHQHGRGVSPNSSEAFKWCRKAAEQGYADAQNTLGWRYQYVKGVGAQNYEEAIKWYEKAAEQGHANAQANLRVLSARGGAPALRSEQINTDDVQVVRLDYRSTPTEEINFDGRHTISRGFGQHNVRTFLHYQRAAQQGDTTAMNNIGVMYANGRGVDQDYDEAIIWFSDAARQGNATARTNLCIVYNHLGWMYAKGIDVEQDYGQAFDWFTKAAEQGHAEAQYNLGVMYANGDHVVQDDVQAVKWFSKAAEQGDIEAQSALRRFGNV